MPETQQQKDALEDYWNLGPDRSLPKLHKYYTEIALKTGKPAPCLRTIKRWSTLNNWQERILLRSKKIATKVEEKVITEEVNMRADSLKNARQAVDSLRSLLASAFYKDKDGKIKLKPGLAIENSRDLQAVASAIVKGELGIQNLIEPEQTFNVKGELTPSKSLEDTIKRYEKAIEKLEDERKAKT